MKPKYTVRPGSRIGIEADIAGRELDKLRKDNKLTTKNVVEAARPAKAPLHPAFTWDDKLAAEHYRRYEARELIRSVYVITEENKEPTQAYVHVSAQPGQDEGRYESVQVVVQSPDLFATCLAELQQKANAAVEAVRQLENAAKGSTDSERLTRISLAVKAFETAADVVRTLH
jgi:hypothetical protein